MVDIFKNALGGKRSKTDSQYNTSHPRTKMKPVGGMGDFKKLNHREGFTGQMKRKKDPKTGKLITYEKISNGGKTEWLPLKD